MHYPKVSVIILNLNGKVYLKNCFESLKGQTYPNYEVIMVDNASTDDSVDYVNKKFPWVKVISNEENMGFAMGNNIGAEHAIGDYLVFLNNDTKVDNRSLEEMVRTVESNSSIGICGCKTLEFDGRTLIGGVGGLCDIYCYPYPRGSGVDSHQYDFITAVFVVSGAAFLIRHQLFAKIGGFDSKYFIYVEEMDLCWRTHLFGYRVVVNPFSVVYHKGGRTTSKIDYAKRRYFMERNTLRTLLKNYDTFTLFRVLPSYFALIFPELLLSVLLGNMQRVTGLVRAILWNIVNFKGTWCLHNKIQKTRVVSDEVIQSKLIRKSLKILHITELLKHASLNA